MDNNLEKMNRYLATVEERSGIRPKKYHSTSAIGHPDDFISPAFLPLLREQFRVEFPYPEDIASQIHAAYQAETVEGNAQANGLKLKGNAQVQAMAESFRRVMQEDAAQIYFPKDRSVGLERKDIERNTKPAIDYVAPLKAHEFIIIPGYLAQMLEMMEVKQQIERLFGKEKTGTLLFVKDQEDPRMNHNMMISAPEKSEVLEYLHGALQAQGLHSEYIRIANTLCVKCEELNKMLPTIESPVLAARATSDRSSAVQL